MTRASLLHILDNLGGISETEVQELEQLAATFPYCQTAHLLLAKASHDRGSMLAAQRLRRAATYAVDRQRLRALIELPAPLPSAQLAAPADATRVETASVLLEIAPAPIVEAELLPEAGLIEADFAPDSNSSEVKLPSSQNPAMLVAAPAFIKIPPSTPLEVAAADMMMAPASEEVSPAPAPHHTPENAPQPASEITFAEEVPAATTATSNLPENEEAEVELVAPEDEREIIPAAASELPGVTESAATIETEAMPATEAAAEADIESHTPALAEALAESSPSSTFSDTDVASQPAAGELLPVAPPIRPPAEIGSSRFEFGLAETLPVVIPSYSLFDVEKAPAKAATVIPSFWADEEVGYAPGLGSRLGFCLQAHDEYSLDLPPSAFFAPDALLLQHLKQHQPVPPPIPKSIDLIDKFLRSKPRFRAPLPLPPTTEAQADLSVRSTVAEPSLASESLARILARQGKIAKAIEIYERLIVLQPEKKAYFADQIQQLQTFE